MAAAVTIAAGRVTEIPVGKLKHDDTQPRQSIDKASLGDLVASIKAQGILQPLTVRKNGAGLIVVMGHRRLEAAKIAGLKRVPCILRADDDDAVGRGLAQVAENSARASLSQMDLGHWLAGLKRNDPRLTPNDLAARCAKAGLKAITKAQIDQLIALTKLPEWAQGMVGRGEMEPGAAARLLEVSALPAVLTDAEKGITQRIRNFGAADGREVQQCIRNGLDKVGIDLTKIEHWYNEQCVLFAWKTRCKGCEHLKQFNGGAWCLNAKLFKEHQAEAKAAGLGPGGKRPQAEKARDPATGRVVSDERAGEIKAEQREKSLTEKARDYLHAHLARRLMPAIATSYVTEFTLVVWAALGRPGADGSRGVPGVRFADGAGTAADSQEIRSIDSLLTGQIRVGDGRAAAAQEILCSLPWRETLVLARHLLGADLVKCWTLDADFLDLFRKAELAHLAVQHAIDLPEGRRSWDALKGSDIKDAILAQPEKITHPAVLVDLYAKVDEPYVRWSQRDDKDWEGAEDPEEDDQPGDE